MEEYYIGIDAGSVSVNAVAINNKGELIYEYPYKRHFGGVETSVFEVVSELYNRLILRMSRQLPSREIMGES